MDGPTLSDWVRLDRQELKQMLKSDLEVCSSPPARPLLEQNTTAGHVRGFLSEFEVVAGDLCAPQAALRRSLPAAAACGGLASRGHWQPPVCPKLSLTPQSIIELAAAPRSLPAQFATLRKLFWTERGGPD